MNSRANAIFGETIQVKEKQEINFTVQIQIKKV